MSDCFALGPCELRPLAAGEAELLAGWLAGIEPFRSLDFSAHRLSAYLRRPDPALTRLAVVVDGRVGGLVCLRDPWLNGAYLETLAVAEPLQGQGIGRAVVTWAAARAGPNLWACVSSFNAPARAFYAACGFAEVAELPDLVRPGFGEILLRRRGAGG